MHLGAAALRGLDGFVRQFPRDFKTAVATSAIDHYDLARQRYVANVMEKLSQDFFLVQHRHDEGNAHCFLALPSCGQDNRAAMKTKLFSFALLLLVLKSVCFAIDVPAGIKHDAYDRLLKKYVNGQGLVAYEKWKSSAEDVAALNSYLAQFAAGGSKASGNERYASLVNAYNAFVLQWILQNYPTESIWSLKASFKERRHKLSGSIVSLNDIENNNLRPEFGWRTHAVLVCAARSCPPLQQAAYTPGGLDEEAARAYRTWLGRTDLNEFLPDKNEAMVSSIFKWFKGDFDKAGGAKAVLVKYAPAPAKALLGK